MVIKIFHRTKCPADRRLYRTKPNFDFQPDKCPISGVISRLVVVRICADFTPNCSFLVTSTKLSGMIDFNVAVKIRYGAK